ncbi:chromosome segregation protein SMC [Parenemella sanctibonifatiensis]|uniref:Chromosome partition protein Smc n=1 Tax=Parenemella sanctibonifatiensis TaxID=2016505 RepID=A0A255E9F2_9ACTN|nr:chromosome segregation protein SMC [Parenemella sanctibonifatiensis]OYN88198.1 chromosome segregation protein SMC [Parenemella sanctibonifatiensis]
MHLKSLTLRGFKSFASATSFEFEPGITCIVGPNGSGKSNVVDALSWVMGEQGAKSLRGGKMEDVIFAGTSGRAPLGRAEVVLTIDNSDNALPIDYTEVTISRTMFRNGGSEYAINGNPARLLDVQDLLSDSGIGREMHVIVGQGQLDSILQATPEGRRGFVEEAAGVLKHRKRKEKALRKLEATEGNLHRLEDLVQEIRRQLKPLGRQAEVARKAAVIQAEARDARARLLADDLVQAQLSLAADLADERELERQQAAAAAAAQSAREGEAAAEQAVAEHRPALQQAADTWYALAGLTERASATAAIAQERIRHAKNQPTEERRGKSPDELLAEADQIGKEEAKLTEQVGQRRETLTTASEERAAAEATAQAEAKAYSAQLRAVADRREGLAKLKGQVGSAESRAAAADEEVERLEASRAAAQQRAQEATRRFQSLETKVAQFDSGESDLDEEWERAEEAVGAAEQELTKVRQQESELDRRHASLSARLEGLRAGLERGQSVDVHAMDLAAEVLGPVTGRITVTPGDEAAVAAALGPYAESVAVGGVRDAADIIGQLRAGEHGRTALLLAGVEATPAPIQELPTGARPAIDLVTADESVRGAIAWLLASTVVVADLAAAGALVAERPELTAVTADGDVLSGYAATGGSGSGPSLIELQAAVDAAQAEQTTVEHERDRSRFDLSKAEEKLTRAQAAEQAALAKLHESDAEMAALAEQLGQASQQARSATAEADRLQASIEQARRAGEEHRTKLAELTERLTHASDEDVSDPDPAARDAAEAAERRARGQEMEARLALRTLEERVRSLAGRAGALRDAAAVERKARHEAQERRARLKRDADRARAVAAGVAWLQERLTRSSAVAGERRATLQAQAQGAEEQLTAARQAVRDSNARVSELADAAHRDELARQQQRLRVEALAERAMEELGLTAEVLAQEYGPDQLVPVLTRPDGSALTDEDETPEPVPFVRAEQEKRFKRAERNLRELGKVNPLALEEFDALKERHQFLSEQLADLTRTRQDLLDIVTEVDRRVEQVFAEAYADVEKAFHHVFSRLFPGGEGRLVLTEPGQWLTTGIEVEARPPGKKIKRLSLLSGGERSLVAVAFLVSLFMARPSPFYILDEVEAALDDVNLGRLLDIYTELRESSQLLVITHQKRTMEIADALYGVTMRGDGVTTVISQKLPRDQTAVD